MDQNGSKYTLKTTLWAGRYLWDKLNVNLTHNVISYASPNYPSKQLLEICQILTISSLALSFLWTFSKFDSLLHWVKFEAQLFHGPLLQQNYLPVTFVSIKFYFKILKELKVGSSHTLQEFFFLPFTTYIPTSSPSLLSWNN